MKISPFATAFLNIALVALLLVSSPHASSHRPSAPLTSPTPTDTPPLPGTDSSLTKATVHVRQTPLYEPPRRGAPSVRVGGGSRGLAGRTFTLSVLAPEHTGWTTQEQPTLYWYASEPVPTSVQLTIIEEDAIQPLLELNLNPPMKPTIQALSLEGQDIHLQPDREYQWFVAVVNNPEQRSNDIVAGGVITRVVPSDPVRAKLREAGKAELPQIYAEAGLWYDAIEAISERINAKPDDRQLREQRASLLEQVGLPEVAAYDRRMGK